MAQGSASVGIAYDAANRRTSLTLPNGIVVEYNYDDDSQLTGLTYKLGSTTLGDLTYTYDANGQRTAIGGSYARSNLPLVLASATYDDANQIGLDPLSWTSSERQIRCLRCPTLRNGDAPGGASTAISRRRPSGCRRRDGRRTSAISLTLPIAAAPRRVADFHLTSALRVSNVQPV